MYFAEGVRCMERALHCLRIIDSSKKSPTTGINSKLKQLKKKTGGIFEITSPDKSTFTNLQAYIKHKRGYEMLQ